MNGNAIGDSLFRVGMSLLRDERGQDLVEYALLTTFVGLAGAAAWINIRGSLGTTYQSYDTGVQSIYQQPAPGGGS